MMKRVVVVSLTAMVALAGRAQVQTAGPLLVDVSAASASGAGIGGRVWSLPNNGSLGGAFEAVWGAGVIYQVVDGAPALEFEASNDTCMAGPATPPALTGGNSWTIETWIRKSLHKGGEEVYLAWTLREGGGVSPNDRMLEARYYDSQGIAIEHYGGGNLPWGAVVPAVGEWHHVVITRDGTTGIEQLFVDGRLEVSGWRGNTDILPGGDIVIGATWNGSKSDFWGRFQGYIGELRIHPGPLPKMGVVQNYLLGRGTYGRSSDPECIWEGAAGPALPWETAGNWLAGNQPGLTGAMVTFENGNAAELTSDAGMLEAFSPTRGGLVMGGAAKLAVGPDKRVHLGYGAGNHFSFKLAQGLFALPSERTENQDGWLFLGIDGGSADVTVGYGAGSAVIDAARDIQIGGNGGYGTMDIGADGGVYSGTGWIYIGTGDGGTGIVSVADGGEIGCTHPTAGMNVIVGNNGGHGELYVGNGGAVRTHGEVFLTREDNNWENSSALVQLDAGGVIEASRIWGWKDGGGWGTGARDLFLNGGTIANQWSHDWFMYDLDIFLQGGGVTFDIKPDTQAWVRSPLVTDPALGGPDGGIVKTGAGTLVLAAANGFEGPIDVREGTLWLVGQDALPPGYDLSSITVTNGGGIGWAVPGGAQLLLANLDTNSVGEIVIFTENANDTIDLSDFPYLTLTTWGWFDFTGTYIPYGGVYRFAPQEGRILYPGFIGGASSVVVDGNGGVDLTAANTYSGTTTVSNGWLMMSSDSALGSGGDIRILNGSRLMLNAENIPPSVATRLTPDSEGFLILGGQCAGLDIDLTGRPGVYVGTDQDRLDYWGALTPAGGEYHLGGGGVNYWMTGNHGLVLANLQGARAAVIQGAGVVRLAAGNTHTGGTVVTNRGVLFLREDAGLGAVPASPDPSNVFVDGGVVRNADMWFEVHENRGWEIGPGGAEFHPWGGNQMVIKGDLSGTGDILLTDSGTIVLGGAANTWTGGLDLRNGATVQIGWETNFSWERDNLIFGNGGWLALYCEGPLAYSDFFANPLGSDGANIGLTKRGPGTLLMDTDLTDYTWETQINEGTLKVGTPHPVPSAPGRGNTLIGSTLDLNGWTVDIGAITGTGEIIDSAGGAQSVGVGANNASATFQGSVAPDITLRKVGTGNQTLNTFGVNNAEVLQGTLTTVNPTAPTGTLAIASGATLAATGGGIPYADRQGCLLARYYDHNPGPEQFDTPEKILSFLEQRTPSLITTSKSAGDTLDFGYASDNNDGYCRFEPPYDHEPRNQFVACFSGTFRAEATGTYTFGTRSDDGSLVFVDGQCVVDNNDWGGWYGNLASGEVFLDAGEHTFMVFFYEGGGGHGLTVYMAPPGVTAEWEDQNDYSQPTLPQSLLAAMAPSRWNLSAADGANIALSANGAVEIGSSENTGLAGGSVTGTPGTALVKTGSGTLTLAPDWFEMQGVIVTIDGTVALDGPGNVGDLVIGEGTTLSSAAKAGEGIPFMGTGLMGKYYDIWAPSPFPAFDELDTYEAYLASHQPAMLASTLLAGDTFFFGWSGEFFPPPYASPPDREGFQVLWKGRIQLPADDDYTFYTRSDDGSMLFIDGTAIVRNNAMQGMEERSGTVPLTAGWHDIAITYYQGGGGYGLFAEIEGGGMPRQNIPNSILFPLPTDVTDASWLGTGLTASGTLTGTGTFALDGEGIAVNLNITENCTFDGGTAGAASTVIFKTGHTTLTLTGDHSAFHGRWIVLEGELRLADGAVLGSEVFIDSGAVLSVDGDATLLGKITGRGTLRFSGNGTATFGDLSEFLGTIETEPGQSIALTGDTSLDAVRLADFAEVILLDGATLYCFDPTDLPPALVSSNGLLILNVTDANKNLWDMDRLTIMAGTTQQVTACTSGLFGHYYDLTWYDGVFDDLRDAFENFETAEDFLTQHTHTTTVSTWSYGDALYCGGTNNDCWHPAPYGPGSQNFAVTWKGKVRVLEAGLYTFATRSDDNSMLFIDGRVVVYNNYSQATTLRSGTVALSQGLHDIAILFAQGGSGHWMEALIQRPGDPGLIPLPNDMLFADLGDTAVYASIPPYTLTAATVAVQNPGHGTVGMLMGGTLAFSGLWIDTAAVLDVSGAAKIAGPTLTVEIPEDIPKGGKPVLVADFIQASGLNLSGAAFLPVIGSQDARVFYRNQQLFLTRTQGTVMILR